MAGQQGKSACGPISGNAQTQACERHFAGRRGALSARRRPLQSLPRHGQGSRLCSSTTPSAVCVATHADLAVVADEGTRTRTSCGIPQPAADSLHGRCRGFCGGAAMGHCSVSRPVNKSKRFSFGGRLVPMPADQFVGLDTLWSATGRRNKLAFEKGIGSSSCSSKGPHRVGTRRDLETAARADGQLGMRLCATAV